MNRASQALEAALHRFEGLYPETIDLALDRILHVLDRLGRPQDNLPPVIHVAGTNGKGSTCAFLRAMAEASGLRVHVAISPHLVRFNERIRLAGDLVEDAPLIAWLDRVYDAVDGGEITHFEATMAAALLAFSEVPADLLVLEVGLGGRFDASNVVDAPAVSVITPVDYDHKAYLGTDLSRIAWEKAGIIKADCPVVSAIQSDVPAGVIAEEAFSKSAPLTTLRPEDIAAIPDGLALRGVHQRANAALAAKALSVWGHTDVSQSAIEVGCRGAIWPARMQRLEPGPLMDGLGVNEVWLDGGHNPHAARALAVLLEDMGGRTALVTAMMAGKDAAGFFTAFAPGVPHVFTCPNTEGHNGATPEDLAEAARQTGLTAFACDDFDEALKRAAGIHPDRILICGSLYLAGAVLSKNNQIPS